MDSEDSDAECCFRKAPANLLTVSTSALPSTVTQCSALLTKKKVSFPIKFHPDGASATDVWV